MSARDHIARRSNFDETLDYFPTPPYATRALFEYVIPEVAKDAKHLSIWDPACGGGHMSEVFREYGFKEVYSTDIHDHDYSGLDEKSSFQNTAKTAVKDFIVTNPPYGDMTDFVDLGLKASRRGLALLTRIQFLEGQNRYAKLFSVRPPTQVAVFADRISFKQNEVVQKASKMFTHIWVVWLEGAQPRPLKWIPVDAQKTLEKESDYE